MLILDSCAFPIRFDQRRQICIGILPEQKNVVIRGLSPRAISGHPVRTGPVAVAPALQRDRLRQLRDYPRSSETPQRLAQYIADCAGTPPED